ncbi:hypothetical protein [Horticoccus sp. 23ND18S-11]|uniref:hypothetical protein n=1 Tax=Horticoccus sp. 23ND18S-11 TaxID=3391832 RepID=UPI0039C98127
MKSHLASLSSSSLVLAVVVFAGCAEKSPRTAAAAPPLAAPTTAPAGGAPAVARPNDSPAADSAGVTWASLRSSDFEARSRFLAGFKQLEARADEQMNELSNKRAAMASNADTRNWDFAMKEMNDARSDLRFMGEEMAKATAQTWDQQKEKAGVAWLRCRTAYDKVRLSAAG